MKFLVLLALAAMLAGCGRRDDAGANPGLPGPNPIVADHPDITGKWVGQKGPATLELIFKGDGTVFVIAAINGTSGPKIQRGESFYAVTGDHLLMSNSRDGLVSGVGRDVQKILCLTADELKLPYPGGTIDYHRVASPP